MTDALEVARTFCRVGRPILLDHFRPDSCIASVNVAIRALRYFNVTARPLAARCIVMNRCAVAHVRAGDLVGGARMSDFDGAWSVGLGYLPDEPDEPGKWNGHLVATIGADLLLDPSLDQASRPQHDMAVEAFAMRIPAVGYFSQFAFEAARGVSVAYEFMPDDRSYRTAPDWKREYRPIVGAIIRAMRAERRGWAGPRKE